MKTEKDIDNLFKQGLEDPAAYKEYREDDWDNLEALLDKKEKRRGLVFWLPLASGIAAALIVVMALFFNRSTKNNIQPIAANVKHIHQNTSGGIHVADNNHGTVAQAQNGTGTSGRLIQQQAVLTKKFRLPTSVGIRFGGPKNKSFLTLSAVKAGRYTTGQTIADSTSPLRQTETLAAVDEKVFINDDPDKAIAFNELKITPATTLKTNVKPNTKTLTPFRTQMAVTVLAASTLNGVGSFSNSQAGANGGVLFSVGVTRKFTISTGAVYAKTPYSTDFYNYHSGGYKFKTDPTTVNADCRVLDIPLNVDYKLLTKGKNSFSVGSGLSSYIMLRENYHYNYAIPGTPGPTDFDIQNKNRYFMGVLNLDATYQRKLNSKLSLALQPYLKLPLTNIGNGQVPLLSTGMAVGLTWNINSFTKH